MNASLEAFCEANEDRLRSLLGYWPVQVWEVKQFGPLTKYTLGEMPDGRWAMIHHLTEPDLGDPHCHPCRMETHLFSPYVEQRFHEGRMEEVLRPAGSSHVIEPETIHRLVSLPEAEAWSLVFAGPVVREWRHYREEELLRSAA